MAMAIVWSESGAQGAMVLVDGGDEASPEIAMHVHRDLPHEDLKINLGAQGAARVALELLRLAALGGWWPAEVACGAIDQAKIDGIPTLGPDRKTQRGRKAKRGGVR